MKETTLKVLLLSASLLLAPNLKADTIQVTANLTGTTTWYNTNEYVLNGFIYVLAGGVAAAKSFPSFLAWSC